MRKFLLTLGVFFVLIFALNILLIQIGKPAFLGKHYGLPNTKLSSSSEQYVAGSNNNKTKVNIDSVDKLNSGGIGGLSTETRGYVNFFDDEDTIYVSLKNEPSPAIDYVIAHESAHILQKKVIAKESGGYPVWWNPIQSFVYYANLLRLNNDLSRYAPNSAVNKSMVPYIETNADCLAQTASTYPQRRSYVGYNYCSSSQYAAAYAIKNGEWPTKHNMEKYFDLMKNQKIFPFSDAISN
jgi:hypothetical protein